jgi:Mg2+ and Co2+ transporter CorA
MGREGIDKTQEEIIEEMAKALGRSGDLLEDILAKLDTLDREMEKTEDVRSYNIMVEEFNSLRRRAMSRREMLMIHREAIGVRKHRYVDICYPIPGKKSKKPVNGYD